MRRIISVLLENQPGALSRVVGLFSQRGYNIESLTVAPTDDPTLSRLNITTNVKNESAYEQIEKHLHKLIDILKVSNITESEHVERELMLTKVKASGFARAEVKRTADIFRGQIIDVTSQIYTIQLIGTGEKLDAFLAAVGEATEIIEVARSGIVGMARGERALKA
ncbi:acetolactate synthase small subunit [Photobacterium angustum]|uniref:Acetolactate synthase small subunit n=1 Tax=Photobacterium angustum TaxID=661 RepID=A0A2T3LWJ9_PHOAN|nr:acetolactate synthase small subunit [Photobacterium angustum]KJF81813.1 acetolactate synthase 3 regulatory subunit [Photobacterium damselae subsp. damselae]KJF94842.1 acetolactate synthase 3 regulatory subunit [Photobacterium angustum]KJG01804.1 acetolactate synthase 3 regulatory subunit [Photobacterium angustum]KJG06802.1 acetolactate synthase 3 regulatory subunit [Photobacterium angustum]KJG16269.1 acetolactate synthase 3 regulatory subunit [Photobacterium angustum]